MKGRIVVIMGVSGCGKSTIGEALVAQTENSIYLEGDELHPVENIERMSSGKPLRDQDRWPWFDRIIAKAKANADQQVFIGCSALKRSYRDYLFENFQVDNRLLYLKGSFEIIHQRMESREHFMPSSLLNSQFDALEEPDPESENCLAVSIEHPVNEIIAEALDWLT